MYQSNNTGNSGIPSENAPSDSENTAGGPSSALSIALGLLLTGLSLADARASAQSLTNSLITAPLSLKDAVNTAMRQNPAILKAGKDLEASHGIVIQTRAIAIPKVSANGNYSASEPGDTDAINAPGFSYGNDQNWESQVVLSQSLYEGGRILSSYRTAKLTGQRALLDYQTVIADTVLNTEVAYYDVLMARQQITVQEQSVELLTKELDDTTKRFDAGTVPKFNVLRAEVEVANARPRLIRAKNSYRIAKNNLANILGYNIPRETIEDIPLILTGKLEKDPYHVDLSKAIGLALERRTELESLRKGKALQKEALISAKAGYLPSIQAFGGYDAHNSKTTTDLSYGKNGWIAGVKMNWNFWDGGMTRGKTIEARARLEHAEIELDDTGRKIELEVRTAYSNFIEADEVLTSQEKVVEQAEEALRLAVSRSDAGTGTQLDVLSAQTALTEARTTHLQALHDYQTARARLERAIGPKPAGK